MNPRTTLPAKTTARCSAVRISNPCDSCVVRRVKCGVERPCHECRKRGLDCTSLRARKKRGPKGPRPSTSERARARLYQQRRAAAVLAADKQSEAAFSPSITTNSPDDDDGAAAGDRDQGADDKHQSDHQEVAVQGSSGFRSLLGASNCCMTCHSPGKHHHQHRRIPLSTYYHFIDIFHTRLYPIWPVVSPNRLMADMAFNENDHSAFALASALCAATISQLRLREHHTTESPAHDTVSSLTFAQEAERFRSAYDYREDCGLPSLLTAFFLHMYYSNANKLRTAALLLREAITCCHTLELHRSDTLTALGSAEQSLCLRVYWLLFISELTFAAQNGLPTIMQPIDAMPHYEHDHKGADLRAFMSLTRLFSFLRTPARAMAGGGGTHGDMATAGTDLAAVQAKLASDGHDAALNETQRVDLCVTRQWIRILTWEYMTRRFPMSCHTDDPAFSLLLPVQIGREVLSFMATVNSSFILAHGYGMELKIFRMADAILDIMMCAPSSTSSNGRMVAGAGDVLSSLQKIVFMVGGEQSEFFGRLQRRLATFAVASGVDPCRMLSAAEVVDGQGAEGRGVVDDDGDRAEWPWGSRYSGF